MGEIHLNDIGTALRPTIKDEDGDAVDVSSATSLIIYLTKPDGTKISKTATLTNDGTDGIIEYVTVDGDLDQIGMWKLQGYVEVNNGKWYSDIHSFRVHRNIN